MCIHPFIFNGLECQCSEGYLLDDNSCVNILFQLKLLNQSDIYLEQQLMTNVSEIKQQQILYYQQSEDNLQRNTSNLQVIIAEQYSKLNEQIDSLSQFSNYATQQFDNVQNDIQKVNNSLTQQIQLSNSQLQQQITALNTSVKQQFDTQKQQIVSANQNIVNVNSQLTASISSVNSYLQNQIDVTKNDVRNVQSSITGINGLINNINNVNSVQSADITALKAQSGSNMNGAFWCKMMGTLNYVYSEIQGYCTSLKLCCHSNYLGIYLTCFTNSQNYGTRTYPMAECGSYITV
ncbi:Hypothetical_protein [Hexamita inflata]|uniref:Hypothetical_protein n=1 Tax=Hexamita inflata TaxID=28002 RepID=A0AA86TPA1_9EUKA|nr:Hypothetical protein HINF_LOCUS8632 [Hexamita inflata]CAI9923410.1 Hypothetical protein HINF_LOCUS11055 [Hexamita inflata]